MRDSTDLKLTSLGIKIHPKLARPLGVRAQSPCWGVWFSPREKLTKSYSTRQKPSPKDDKQLPHLVISPHHPDKWPAIFHLEVRLQRQPEALPRLLSLLKSNGINILSIETAVASYQQLYATLTCEQREFSKQVKDELDFLAQGLSNAGAGLSDAAAVEARTRLRDNVHRTLGHKQLMLMTVVYSLVRAGGSDPDSGGFLAEDAVRLGGNPWLLCRNEFQREDLGKFWNYLRSEHVIPDKSAGAFFKEFFEAMRVQNQNSITKLPAHLSEHASGPEYSTWREIFRQQEKIVRDQPNGSWEWLRDVWRLQGNDAVAVRAPLTLAYTRIWQPIGMEPIEFKYSASDKMLRCDRGAIQDGIVEQAVKDSTINPKNKKSFRKELVDSMAVIAAFNRQERILRCRFLRGWFAREVAAKIIVRYNLPESVSLGVLHHIVEKLVKEELLTENVSSSMTRSHDDEECAQLELTVVGIGETNRKPWKSKFRDKLVKELKASLEKLSKDAEVSVEVRTLQDWIDSDTL